MDFTSSIFLERNLHNLSEFVQGIKTAPGFVVFSVIIASAIMIFMVLEMQRAYYFITKNEVKNLKPYTLFWEFKYSLKFLNGWKNERLSKLVYLSFMPWFVAILMILSRPRSAGSSYQLTHFIVYVIVGYFVWAILPAIFYVQQFKMPKFQRKISAIVYIAVMSMLLVYTLYIVYYSGHII